jgi:hypothetical protein
MPAAVGSAETPVKNKYNVLAAAIVRQLYPSSPGIRYFEIGGFHGQGYTGFINHIISPWIAGDCKVFIFID